MHILYLSQYVYDKNTDFSFLIEQNVSLNIALCTLALLSNVNSSKV